MVIQMKLGRHVSIAGGIDKAFERAQILGCNCLQIFAKNPRGWKGRDISTREIRSVKKKLLKFNMSPLVVHSTYLINPAAPEDELWEKSTRGLIDDYSRSGKINADYLVIHPGNHKNKGLKYGIKRIIACLNTVLKIIKNDCIILLENVAGAGTGIGSNFHELEMITDGIEDNHRIGFCLDTCHAFAAGYDFRKKEQLELMLKEIKNTITLEKLKIIHVNDSKYKFGLNKDVHAHIGEGYIGLKGIGNIVNHPDFKEIPFILETPHFKNKDKDIETIISLREKGE